MGRRNRINTIRFSLGNSIVFLVMLAVNAAGALGLWNGTTQKEVSDRFPTLITPARKTFGIWGVIYLLLLCVLVLLLFDRSKESRSIERSLRVLFPFSCIANGAWIVLFSYIKIEAAFFVILILNLLLFLINLQLSALSYRLSSSFNEEPKNRTASRKKLNVSKIVFVKISFGLYSGWLFLAAFLNLFAIFSKWHLGDSGSAAPIFSGISLCLILPAAFLLMKKIKNPAFLLPVLWGYWGIYKALHENAAAPFWLPILVITLAAIGAAELIWFWKQGEA